jgi:hypothetical protein
VTYTILFQSPDFLARRYKRAFKCDQRVYQCTELQVSGELEHHVDFVYVLLREVITLPNVYRVECFPVDDVSTRELTCTTDGAAGDHNDAQGWVV